MIIIETPLFTSQIKALAHDDDYAALQIELIRHPTAGDLIPGGGGIRKIRMRLPGRGKSGGARVIYFWRRDDATVLMLLAYAKNVRANLSASQVAILRDLVKELR